MDNEQFAPRPVRAKDIKPRLIRDFPFSVLMWLLNALGELRLRFKRRKPAS